MPTWTPQQVANYEIQNYKNLIKLDNIQVKANKEELYEMKHNRRKLPKFPVNQHSLKENIADQSIRDYIILDKLDRIAINSKLTPEQIKKKNSQTLTPVDKELIRYYKSQIRNINPDVGLIAKPTFVPFPKSNHDWYLIDTVNESYDVSKPQHELRRLKNAEQQNLVLINNLNTQMRNETDPTIKKELWKDRNQLNNKLGKIREAQEAVNNEIINIGILQRDYIENTIKPENARRLAKYDSELRNLVSGNVSLERLHNESDEDYVNRIDNNLASMIQGDIRMEAEQYINLEFLNYLQELGIYREVAEQVNNGLSTIEKESVLKTKPLFTTEINKIKTPNTPLYKLSSQDIINFIYNYNRKNPIIDRNLLAQNPSNIIPPQQPPPPPPPSAPLLAQSLPQTPPLISQPSQGSLEFLDDDIQAQLDADAQAQLNTLSQQISPSPLVDSLDDNFYDVNTDTEENQQLSIEDLYPPIQYPLPQLAIEEYDSSLLPSTNTTLSTYPLHDDIIDEPLSHPNKPQLAIDYTGAPEESETPIDYSSYITGAPGEGENYIDEYLNKSDLQDLSKNQLVKLYDSMKSKGAPMKKPTEQKLIEGILGLQKSKEKSAEEKLKNENKKKQQKKFTAEQEELLKQIKFNAIQENVKKWQQQLYSSNIEAQKKLKKKFDRNKERQPQNEQLELTQNILNETLKPIKNQQQINRQQRDMYQLELDKNILKEQFKKLKDKRQREQLALSPPQNTTQAAPQLALEHGHGFKKPKTVDAKKRLELIQGEIEAGNDNPILLDEAKYYLEELCKLKAIDKKDALRYYNQLKKYNN